jgi:hypothetical protein
MTVTELIDILYSYPSDTEVLVYNSEHDCYDTRVIIRKYRQNNEIVIESIKE